MKVVHAIYIQVVLKLFAKSPDIYRLHTVPVINSQYGP